jgi:hypothetical protein
MFGDRARWPVAVRLASISVIESDCWFFVEA